MTEDQKHGSPPTGKGGRNVGNAPRARVFKRRIDCAPNQAGDDRTEAELAPRPAAADAAGKDRSPPRAF